ncbi:hypothetical protein [Streptomyces sp. NPDC060001]|uniref:hypothetical protein n=1 Tax=Streptomyces sp. NPDC060001 TaxID=3347032 RepID=UPI003690E61B
MQDLMTGPSGALHPGGNVAQVPTQSAEALRRVRAGQATGYRIMRSTEVAPGWWGKRREVGETGSAAVANNFCDEQNAVTMDPNRAKRIQFSAEPIYTEAADHQPTPATVTHANGLTFKVVDGGSNLARTARQTRQLTMADGTTWTVGLPIGWRGREAAWHNPETEQERSDRIQRYGASIRRRDRRQLGLNITPKPYRSVNV